MRKIGRTRRAAARAALGGAALVAAFAGSAALAQEPERVRYPIARPRLDCLGRPCGPFRLLDVDLRVARQGEDQAGVRLEIDRRWVLGLLAESERRGASLRSARVELEVIEADDGSLAASGAWRGRQLDLRFGGARRADELGGGWRLDGGLGFRPGPDLELRVDLQRDLQPQPPRVLAPRAWTSARVGLLWQRGAALDLTVGIGYARLRSGLGERSERWGIDLGAVWLTGDVQTRLAARLDDERGRFDRRDAATAADVDVRIAGHLLGSAGIGERVELGVAERARSYRAGLAFFGRRYRFARGGATGARTVELSRAAWDAGFGVDRAYGLDDLRRLRERLRLAGAPALGAPIERLYEAQVQERQVEQLAVRWEGERRQDLGWRIDRIVGSVGIPWPLSLPISRDERRVELLRLEFDYLDARYGFDIREIGRAVTVETRLHRELALGAEWRQLVRTPLELALGFEPDDRFGAWLRYRYGR